MAQGTNTSLKMRFASSDCRYSTVCHSGAVQPFDADHALVGEPLQRAVPEPVGADPARHQEDVAVATRIDAGAGKPLLAGPPPAHRLLQVVELHRVLQRHDDRLLHRDVDVLALPGRFGLPQARCWRRPRRTCSRRGWPGRHARASARCPGSRPGRACRRAPERRCPPPGTARRDRSGRTGVMLSITRLRPQRGQRFVAEPALVHDAGPFGLDQDVRTLDQAPQPGLVFGAVQVERDAALARVVVRERQAALDARPVVEKRRLMAQPRSAVAARRARRRRRGPRTACRVVAQRPRQIQHAQALLERFANIVHIVEFRICDRFAQYRNVPLASQIALLYPSLHRQRPSTSPHVEYRVDLQDSESCDASVRFRAMRRSSPAIS